MARFEAFRAALNENTAAALKLAAALDRFGPHVLELRKEVAASRKELKKHKDVLEETHDVLVDTLEALETPDDDDED